MTTTISLIGCLIAGLGPHLVLIAAALCRNGLSQLVLVSLASSTLFYLVPVVSIAIWRAVLGGASLHSAEGFFAVWWAVSVEGTRFLLCHWMLKAELVCRSKNQTMLHVRSPMKLAPLAVGVAVGMSTMQSLLTLGVVSNAAVEISWIDHGDATGVWMNPLTPDFEWFDVSSCPQLPRIVVASLRCVAYLVTYLCWSLWMMYGAAALLSSRSAAAAVDEVRVRLTDVGGEPDLSMARVTDNAGPVAEGDGSSTAGPLPADHGAPQLVNRDHPPAVLPSPCLRSGERSTTRLTNLSRRLGFVLIVTAVALHVVTRLCFLAESDATTWSADAQRWITDRLSTRGCLVTLPLQATIGIVSVVETMLLTRKVAELDSSTVDG